MLFVVVGCSGAPGTDGVVFDPGGHASLASDPDSATIPNGGKQTITITNGGDTRTGELAIVITGDGADAFRVETGTNCTTLAPGASCDVEVGVPLHANALPAQATVSIGDADANATIGLSTDGGTSSAALVWTPMSDNVDIAGCMNATGTTFTLYNAGMEAIDAIAIVPPDPTRFHLLSNTCDGDKLPSGATCTVTVGAVGMPTGTTPATMVATGQVQGAQVNAVATLKPYVSSCIAVTPLALSFLAVPGNKSVNEQVMVTNYSPTPRTLVWDFSSGDFVAANHGACTTAIASGQSCTVLVNYSATQNGQETASLSIHDVGAPALAVVQLTGKGVPPMTFDVDKFEFATINGTTYPPQLFTLTTNAPTGQLNPTMSNPAFAVTATTCDTLLANESCTVEVTFTPAMAGGNEQMGDLVMTAETGDTARLALKGKAQAFTGK